MPEPTVNSTVTPIAKPSVIPLVTPPTPVSKQHGGTRGADLPRLSSQTQGRFGRMFRALPPAQWLDSDLKNLAQAMTAEAERLVDAHGDAILDENGMPIPKPTAETKFDDEENTGIPAGYTYFGQFIDHDLTFDPASFLQKQNDPEGMVDFRTPRFDLDSLYGQGPADQPYLYAPDEVHLDAGHGVRFGAHGAFDLPRAPNGRALVGDKRNDENVIVSQLQSGFLRFHNRVADVMLESSKATSFADIARIVRWHYQWCVLHDFLPRFVGQDLVNTILPHLVHGDNIHEKKPDLRFYQFHEDPFIPIEFTAAAYRFGHSVVRPIYRLNQSLGVEKVDPDFEKDHARITAGHMLEESLGRQFIFAAVANSGLNGFRPLPKTFGIDWHLFFGDIDLSKLGRSRVQPAYKIDTSLVNPLGFLPEFSLPKAGGKPGDLEIDEKGDPKENPAAVTSNLALRNLLRGQSMGLPSGQAIARTMGLTALRDDEILIGKANTDGLPDPADPKKGNQPITNFGASFEDNAPLWVYVLAEAQDKWRRSVADMPRGTAEEEQAVNAMPVSLGPVGGRIIAETFIGLLLGDRNSFLRQDPTWLPWVEFCDGKDPRDFKLLDLLLAGQKWQKPTHSQKADIAAPNPSD